MKRILMRAATSPLELVTPRQLIERNTIADNSGNMLFSHSLFRILMTEDTAIDTIQVDHWFSRREVAEINEKYDCFVIPLANAFRSGFKTALFYLEKLVSKLKIPCIVIGVGMQAPVNSTFTEDFDFDGISTKFLKSVLERSQIVGIRGEMTARYLKKLGFKEEQDFTVIGCPSMYMWGDELPTPRIEGLDRESLVCVNRKPALPKKLHDFINKSMVQLPNHYFLPQNISDIELLYAGVPLTLPNDKKMPLGYPKVASDEIFKQDRVRAFTNVEDWMRFLRTSNFSFGSRIHGNIAAVLAGTPTFIFGADGRVQELAQYHNIQHMLAKDIKGNTDIFDICNKADFMSVNQGHKERFSHFADFLSKNGLVYEKDLGIDKGPTHFDVEMAKMNKNRKTEDMEIHSFLSKSQHEQEDILAWYEQQARAGFREYGNASGLERIVKRVYRSIRERYGS